MTQPVEGYPSLPKAIAQSLHLKVLRREDDAEIGMRVNHREMDSLILIRMDREKSLTADTGCKGLGYLMRPGAPPAAQDSGFGRTDLKLVRLQESEEGRHLSRDGLQTHLITEPPLH